MEERTRERAPLDWAMAQMNLGNALGTLGAREAGPAGMAQLEEAAKAFDACLTVTMAVWPPEWVSEVRAHRDGTRAEIERRKAD
uniref:hypothetical protein n=1 Tax=uncultured Sphingomonas sp. TaxID=158754 RepID=UPI0025F0CC4B|nr:hypothetical protein [uncultured Sphingomonas sp.]